MVTSLQPEESEDNIMTIEVDPELYENLLKEGTPKRPLGSSDEDVSQGTGESIMAKFGNWTNSFLFTAGTQEKKTTAGTQEKKRTKTDIAQTQSEPYDV